MPNITIYLENKTYIKFSTLPMMIQKDIKEHLKEVIEYECTKKSQT